jgi:hypothetical protein
MNLRYLEDQKVWLVPPPEGQSFEVLVAGDSTAPDAARMAMVATAISVLDALRARAVDYLEAFVDRAKFAKDQEWYFEWLESGRLAGQRQDQFSLYFSIEGDTYGEWSVTFQLSSSRHFPVGFSRRQV